MIVHVYTRFQLMIVQNNNILRVGKTNKAMVIILVDDHCKNIITSNSGI